MSLNETHRNSPEASLLGLSSNLPKGNEEYCLFDNENTDVKTIYDDFETEIEQVTFSLDEEYLKKVIEESSIEDTSETESIFDNDDSVSETDSEDNDIIIKQTAFKDLTQCVIVDKIDGHIKRCENSKSF
jgi:hypothetical protein